MKIKNSLIIVGLVSFTTLCLTAQVSTPPLSFNVTFLDEGQANVTGLIGVVGAVGETWNQGIGTTGSPVTNLVDITGTETSSVSVSGLGKDGRTIGGAALTVFNGNRNNFSKGIERTLSIQGLTPGANYDLYIYSLSHASSSWGDLTNTERAAGRRLHNDEHSQRQWAVAVP